MCLNNYKISTCHLNLLIFSGLMIFFSSFGLSNKSQEKIVGDLNIEGFCYILFIMGIILLIYSLKNLCYKKNEYNHLP